MLALTETAATVIRAVVDRPEMPDSAGLRIASSSADTAEGLTVSAAPTPEDGDQVVENQGARVFLEPAAATMLDEMVLDARVDDQGRAEFLIAAR